MKHLTKDEALKLNIWNDGNDLEKSNEIKLKHIYSKIEENAKHHDAVTLFDRSSHSDQSDTGLFTDEIVKTLRSNGFKLMKLVSHCIDSRDCRESCTETNCPNRNIYYQIWWDWSKRSNSKEIERDG